MRVISGKRRGAKLIAPAGLTTRPTTDRIKENLFNMIAFDIPGCCFLDLFSGSGAIGIESLSRGAKKAVFVDQDLKAIKCIEENLKKTSLKEDAIVYNMDIQNAIKQLSLEHQKFNIIFLDPPYQLNYIEQVLKDIIHYDLLDEEAYIILEHSSQIPLVSIKEIRLIKEKVYKTTTFSFFERIR